MDRRDFIKGGLASITMMTTLNPLLDAFRKAGNARMPVLFVGHGSPMNAIEKNEFHKAWERIGKELPHPRAILCVSAHWLTRGTMVTAMPKPRTIHDFGGFPDDLFAQQYPAPGSMEVAEETIKAVSYTSIVKDHEWGLDHGAWSILLPMFPKADIPVLQLSIDYTKPAQYHYELAEQLALLREKGVLIVGSGNIVHNLSRLDFSGKPFDWAVEFDEKVKQLILAADHRSLIEYNRLGAAAAASIPTNEHYLPLLYTLALRRKDESLRFFNEKIDLGSIAMRSVLIG